jgi:hypothetical protein
MENLAAGLDTLTGVIRTIQQQNERALNETFMR